MYLANYFLWVHFWKQHRGGCEAHIQAPHSFYPCVLDSICISHPNGGLRELAGLVLCLCTANSTLPARPKTDTSAGLKDGRAGARTCPWRRQTWSQTELSVCSCSSSELGRWHLAHVCQVTWTWGPSHHMSSTGKVPGSVLETQQEAHGRFKEVEANRQAKSWPTTISSCFSY